MGLASTDALIILKALASGLVPPADYDTAPLAESIGVSRKALLTFACRFSGLIGMTFELDGEPVDIPAAMKHPERATFRLKVTAEGVELASDPFNQRMFARAAQRPEPGANECASAKLRPASSPRVRART